MKKAQRVSEKKEKLKLIDGKPPEHGVKRYSDLPVGPMENAQNQKSEFAFDYGQNVF